jgi:hypothetical protein
MIKFMERGMDGNRHILLFYHHDEELCEAIANFGVFDIALESHAVSE